jgi:hypothetical protein
MDSGQIKCSRCGRVHATFEEVDDGDVKLDVPQPGMRMHPADDIPGAYEIRCPNCGNIDVVHFPLAGKSVEPWEN